MYVLEKALIDFIKTKDLEGIRNLIDKGLISTKVSDPTSNQSSLCCTDPANENRGLMHYAIDEGNEEIASYFLTVLPNTALHLITTKAQTTLMLAAQKGWFDIAKRLIEAGVKIDARDYSKLSALMYATTSGNADLVKMIVDHSLSALNVTITDLVKMSQFYDTNGNTPLHLAAAKGHMSVINIFISDQFKFNMNLRNFRQETPLIFALREKQTLVVKQLLENHADTNAVTSEGLTPLSTAVELDDVEMARLLLAKGANCQLGEERQLPLSIAIRKSHLILVALLLRYGAAIHQDLPKPASSLVEQLLLERYWLTGTKINGRRLSLPGAINRLTEVTPADFSLENQEQSILSCCKVALAKNKLNAQERTELTSFIKKRACLTSLKTLILHLLNDKDYVASFEPFKQQVKRLPPDLREKIKLPEELELIAISSPSHEDIMVALAEQLVTVNANKHLVKELAEELETEFSGIQGIWWAKRSFSVILILALSALFIYLYHLLAVSTLREVASLLETLLEVGALLIGVVGLMLSAVLIIVTMFVAINRNNAQPTLVDYRAALSIDYLRPESTAKLEDIHEWIETLIGELNALPNTNQQITESLRSWRIIENSLLSSQPISGLLIDLKRVAEQFEADQTLIHDEVINNDRLLQTYNQQLFFKPRKPFNDSMQYLELESGEQLSLV